MYELFPFPLVAGRRLVQVTISTTNQQAHGDRCAFFVTVVTLALMGYFFNVNVVITGKWSEG
jgi:hypothetical protein